jgi:hypothetical protein
MESSKIDLKTYGFVEDLVINPSFIARIKGIRRKHHIPDFGFNIGIFEKLAIKEKSPRLPTNIDKAIFLADVKNLLFTYNLSSDWIEFFSDYLLFNYFGDYLERKQIIVCDLGFKTETKAENNKILNNSNSFGLNPIALLLPPFTTSNELKDYIDCNIEEIERLQKRYRHNAYKISKLKKIKKENEVRDNYIYHYRKIKKKDLVSRVAEKFGQILDYTYINKIIKEQIRRKSAGI